MTVEPAPSLEERRAQLGLVDPTDRRPRQRRAANRLDSLVGKRAGFMENRKGNAQVVLARVRDRLAAQYDFAGIVWQPKFLYSAPADPALLEELAEQCDFVVTAIGD